MTSHSDRSWVGRYYSLAWRSLASLLLMYSLNFGKDEATSHHSTALPSGTYQTQGKIVPSSDRDSNFEISRYRSISDIVMLNEHEEETVLKDLEINHTSAASYENKIIFASNRTDEFNKEGDFEIYAMDFMRDIKQLTSNDKPDFYPSISRYATRVAFVRYYSKDSSAIIMLDKYGGETTLTEGPRITLSAQAWSPDDTEITYSVDREGVRTIYTINSDGSNRKRLIEGEFPALSPDGTKIVFVRETGTANASKRKLYISDVRTKKVSQIPDTDADAKYKGPTWISNYDIVVTESRPNSVGCITRINVNKGTKERITNPGPNFPPSNQDDCFAHLFPSPFSKDKIIFGEYIWDTNYSGATFFQLSTVGRDGKGLERLTDNQNNWMLSVAYTHWAKGKEGMNSSTSQHKKKHHQSNAYWIGTGRKDRQFRTFHYIPRQHRIRSLGSRR